MLSGSVLGSFPPLTAPSRAGCLAPGRPGVLGQTDAFPAISETGRLVRGPPRLGSPSVSAPPKVF